MYSNTTPRLLRISVIKYNKIKHLWECHQKPIRLINRVSQIKWPLCSYIMHFCPVLMLWMLLYPSTYLYNVCHILLHIPLSSFISIWAVCLYMFVKMFFCFLINICTCFSVSARDRGYMTLETILVQKMMMMMQQRWASHY